MKFARLSTYRILVAFALFLPNPLGHASECDIVAAYCAADGYYYDICASCTDGDCWDELMAAITAAGMSYEGDEPVGQGMATCFDEPCASGNPSCPGIAFQLYGMQLPWRVGVHVVCCNGMVIKAAATGHSYCQALAKAKATAFRLAHKKCSCCPTPGIRCYYTKTLASPVAECCQSSCQSSKDKRGLRGVLSRLRRR